MGLSWSHILIVLVLFVLLFGRGKISELMGDVAQGIKSFKKGMADDEEPAEAAACRHQGHRAQAGHARAPRHKDRLPRQDPAQAEIGLTILPQRARHARA